MSAVDVAFQKLRRAGRKALVPFVTAGDPDMEFTAAVLAELAGRGCPIIELGIPYSDPIADGPVIQASYTRALGRGVKLGDVLGMTRGWMGGKSQITNHKSQGPTRSQGPEKGTGTICSAQTANVGQHQTAEQIEPVPSESRPALVAMVSHAIVYRHGVERFVDEALEGGIAGAIVPDLPVEESAALADICRRADFSLIQLVAPTTPRERQARIAAASSGFLYYVSVTGITGERTELPDELLDNLAWLRGQTDLPICVGFGISRPDQVRAVAQAADGVIVGSAIVRRIAEADKKPRQEVLADVGAFVSELLAALPQ
jgi:tryptophan synthase alpha chain